MLCHYEMSTAQAIADEGDEALYVLFLSHTHISVKLLISNIPLPLCMVAYPLSCSGQVPDFPFPPFPSLISVCVQYYEGEQKRISEWFNKNAGSSPNTTSKDSAPFYLPDLRKPKTGN